MTLKPIMTRGEFEAFCQESGVGGLGVSIFDSLDPKDGNKDGVIDFAAIPWREFRDITPLVSPGAIVAWHRASAWFSGTNTARRGVRAAAEVQLKRDLSLDWLKRQLVAYRRDLIDITISTEALAFGNPIGINDAENIVFEVSGISAEMLYTMQAKFGGHARLVVDGKSRSENLPMLYEEGHSLPNFEPRTYSRVWLAGAQELALPAEVTLTPYVMKPAGFMGRVFGSDASWADVIIGLGAAAVAVTVIMSGKRGQLVAGAAAAAGAEGRSGRGVRAPELEVPGEALKELREAREGRDIPKEWPEGARYIAEQVGADRVQRWVARAEKQDAFLSSLAESGDILNELGPDRFITLMEMPTDIKLESRLQNARLLLNDFDLRKSLHINDMLIIASRGRYFPEDIENLRLLVSSDLAEKVGISNILGQLDYNCAEPFTRKLTLWEHLKKALPEIRELNPGLLTGLMKIDMLTDESDQLMRVLASHHGMEATVAFVIAMADQDNKTVESFFTNAGIPKAGPIFTKFGMTEPHEPAYRVEAGLGLAVLPSEVIDRMTAYYELLPSRIDNLGENIKIYMWAVEIAKAGKLEISAKELTVFPVTTDRSLKTGIKSSFLAGITETELFESIILRQRLFSESLGLKYTSNNCVDGHVLAVSRVNGNYELSLEFGQYEASGGLQFSLYDTSSGGAIKLATLGFHETASAMRVVRLQGGVIPEENSADIRERFRVFSGGIEPLPWLADAAGRHLLGRARTLGKDLLWIKGHYLRSAYPHIGGDSFVKSWTDAENYWKTPPLITRIMAMTFKGVADRDAIWREVEPLGAEKSDELLGTMIGVAANTGFLRNGRPLRNELKDAQEYRRFDNSKHRALLDKLLSIFESSGEDPSIAERISEGKRQFVRQVERGPHIVSLYAITGKKLGFKGNGEEAWLVFKGEPGDFGRGLKKDDRLDAAQFEKSLSEFDEAFASPQVVKTRKGVYQLPDSSDDLPPMKSPPKGKSPLFEAFPLSK